MIDGPATASQVTGPRGLDGLAAELAGWGWVVRFEAHAFAAGAPGGHVVLTRPLSSTAEYVVAGPRRHEFHVWGRSGQDTWPLGTVVDVADLHDLLRREIRTSGRSVTPRQAGLTACG